MNTFREFFISKEDYLEAKDSCDLGEYRKVRIYFYPHKDDISSIFKVREVRPEVDAAIEKMVKTLEKLYENSDFCSMNRDICFSALKDWKDTNLEGRKQTDE